MRDFEFLSCSIKRATLLQSLGNNAFFDCKNLKSVTISDGVGYIGNGTFRGCKSLESINMPENVKCDKKTFKDCKNLSV